MILHPTTSPTALALQRVAEVVKQDVDVATNGSPTYRIKRSVSFKYEDS
jgi:hypothetical protein